VLLVLLAGALWSTMGIGIRLMEVANVWQILFYRSLAFAPFLFTIIAVRSAGKPLAVIRRAGLPAVIGAFGLVLAFAGGIFAIQQTTVANAMFLFAAAPFMAAVLGLMVLGESVRRATWMAMIVAIAGIGIMVVDGFAAGNGVGNIAALASAAGFAIFTVALRYGKLEDMLPAVFLAGVFAAITGAVMCWSQDYTFSIPGRDIAIAFGLGVGQIGIGLSLYTYGSKSVPAAELALLSMTEVLLGPVWVWLFLGEQASVATLAGGAVLMFAIGYNALSGLRRRPVPVI
jgi:drug/metabolite transporter (DMT)-like permease